MKAKQIKLTLMLENRWNHFMGNLLLKAFKTYFEDFLFL